MVIGTSGVEAIMWIQQAKIKKQLQEDIATDQISIKEYIDPFEKEQKEKERKIKRGIGPLKWQPEKRMRLANLSEGLQPRSASTKAFQAKSKPPVLLVVMIYK